ncbi:hypothetical protein Aperf_G00000068996 [Anoplocephala perfoliata]
MDPLEIVEGSDNSTPARDVRRRRRHLRTRTVSGDDNNNSCGSDSGRDVQSRNTASPDSPSQLATSNKGKGLLLPRHRRSASYGPGEVLFENATRAVEQAEEFMMQLWQQVGRWRVVHYSKLPDWLRDNDYLLWGHRPQLASFQLCFRSIFRIHTETGNIWTHLIGMEIKDG